MRRAFVVVVAISASACSLVVSLDALRQGDAATAPDASNDASFADVIDSASPDDASDASMIDAGDFCAAHPAVVFCDDFDTDATPFVQWSTIAQTQGASASLVLSDASAPFAVHFHDPYYDGGGFSPQAELSKTFTSKPTTSLTYQFDLRIDRYPVGGTISFSPIKPSSIVDTQLYFALNSSSAAFAELINSADGGSTYNSWTLNTRPQPNVWMHVEVDITLGTPNTVMVVLDNVNAFSAPRMLVDPIVFAYPLVGAGVTYETPGSDVTIVDVDNVIVDFE